MQQLPFSQPEVYKSFLDGCNVVRRSDKFFAGIGTDLMIEQELMHSVKTTGGLTHGGVGGGGGGGNGRTSKNQVVVIYCNNFHN